jgi:hypothetical protein
MGLCKDCKHYLANAIEPDMGICRRITLHGSPAAIATTDHSAALMVDETFGCNLFEAK